METHSDSSDEDLVPSNYHWIRFKWMLWVDCCKHWNRRWEFLFAMHMPTILSLIVIIIRVEIPVEHITATSYPACDLEKSWNNLLTTIKDRQDTVDNYYGTKSYNPFIPHLQIAYASFNEVNTAIMIRATKSLKVELLHFSTCQELRKKMLKEYFLVGVCFIDQHRYSETSTKVGTYPQKLHFKLIFPSELRIYGQRIGETWDTRNLYAIPRREQHTNGYMTYIDEGFIMLQKEISEAFIDLVTARNRTEEVFLRKFPVAEHYYDPLSEVMLMRMSMLLVFGYMTTVLYLLKTLVIEREKGLDSMLAILDVTPFIQFYSWFVFTLAAMSTSSLVLLLVLRIPWNHGFAVFNNVPFTCLYALFTAFNIFVLSFCYMMSKFFRKTKVAICAAPIFWILFYLPFASSIESSTPLTETLHPFASLFGNSALGFAMQSIYHLENNEGLHWHNFFKRADLSSKNYSVGTYALIMCFVSIVQALIGICVTKIEKIIYKLIKLFKRDADERIGSENSTRYSKTIILEVRANYKPSAMEVISVSVERGNKLILDEVSFSLYEDEITMLMGHNGSGKTTLIQVLAGIKRPKSGKVVCNVSSDSKLYGMSRDFTGVCLNDSLLFFNLNVKHQLMFFGRMKGVNPLELKKEMKKYLEALELDCDKYVRTEDLTCGQRAKLAVACALIGGSKIVLLDDIALKLDVRDYELIWKLLEKEKFGRVILASTNLSVELEFHADNIIILGQGRVKCTGTGQFLKSLYCFGCHMLISRGDDCIVEEVTKVVNEVLPDIVPASQIGREITYHIESSDIEILEAILQKLEAKREQLNIINISIFETPIEELFCKLGAERTAYDDRKRFFRILNGLSIMHEDHDELVFLKRRINYEMNAFQKLINQWTALFYKHLIFYWSHKTLIPVLIGMPVVVLIYCAIWMTPRMEALPSLHFEVGDYRDAQNLLCIRTEMNPNLKRFIDGYKQNIYWKNSHTKTIDVKGMPIVDYIFNDERKSQYTNLHFKILFGLTVQNHLTAWFNGYLPHVAPLVMNLVYNAILRHYSTADYTIDVELELLPAENKVAVSELSQVSFNMGSTLAIHMSFILCYLTSIRVLVCVAERTSGFHNLQRIAGLTGYNHWICLCVLDICKHMVVMLVSICACYFLLPPVYFPVDGLRWGFCLLLLVATALSMTNLALSLFFKSSHRAFLFLTTLHSTGISFFIALHHEIVEDNTFLSMLPRFIPLYSFCTGMSNTYNLNIRQRLCDDEMIKMISIGLEFCEKTPNCCELVSKTENQSDFDKDAMYLGLVVAYGAIGLCIYECRGFFRREVPTDNYDRALDEHKRRHASDSYEVDDVTAEMIHVQSMKPRMRYYYTAICQNLGLIKNRKILVDRVSFTLKPGETLGIIGTNCNYTNALLNILAGKPSPSFGRVYINSVSMTENPDKARSHIGFVPAVNCVMGEMTCYQALKMFCILYGYERNEIDEICENFAKNFGFYTQLYTRLRKCSTGIKERVSYTIAILKKPALLCIGNYTWSVDPHGRRQLYRLVSSLFHKVRTSLVITSVNNCYTEIICNKIVVMKDGQFMHIGRPSEISSANGEGYVILMRMKKAVQTPQGVLPKVFFRLTAFMEKTFPSSQLVVEGAVMQYFIPIKSTTMPIIYRNLRANSFQLNIESLSVSNLNMSYVFSRITEEATRKLSTSM